MIIPIRCISCGELIGDKWEKFRDDLALGKDPKKILDELKVEKYCCRSMLITHVDLIDEIAIFKKRLIPRKEQSTAPVV
ncbi:MAG: DNA-directed RNA polymerase subunit N [archaeon]